MKIFIENLAFYNEGAIVGGWFLLGTDDRELEDFLNDVVKIDKKHEEWFVADYDCKSLFFQPHEYCNIYELNQAVRQFNELHECDKKKLNAIIESETITTISKLLEALEELDDYFFSEEINSDYDLGYYWLNESGCYEIPLFLAGYVDYAGFGFNCCMDTGGSYTNFGYIEKF